MPNPRFTIFARRWTIDGWKVVELFRWTRDAESGIRRAKQDAAEFGERFESFWATPIKEA